DPTTLDGTIVRLDPDTGLAAAGNPTTTGDENAKRIVAYGLRNPYRFTMRPGTNEAWIGDVGYGTWEEIDRVMSPTTEVRNFGWPCMEGNGRTPGYDAANLNMCETIYTGPSPVYPRFTYRHGSPIVAGEDCGSGTSSISGVSFYAGSVYPAQYRNALFFTDYARGCVWAMRTGTDGLPDWTRIETFATDAGQLVDLQAGPGGDIFGVNIGAGSVVRYVYNGANNPPVASIKSDVTSGPLPLTVTFDGTASSDADGNVPLTYAWDLDGDG
ncbi:PQQ-dependent sugar dehydrogenase, partial [Actinomadura adrarensis]